MNNVHCIAVCYTGNRTWREKDARRCTAVVAACILSLLRCSSWSSHPRQTAKLTVSNSSWSGCGYIGAVLCSSTTCIIFTPGTPCNVTRGIIFVLCVMFVQCPSMHACQESSCHWSQCVTKNPLCEQTLCFLARDSMLSALYAIAPPSVCPSHGWISWKRLNLGACNFHHTVAPSL